MKNTVIILWPSQSWNPETNTWDGPFMVPPEWRRDDCLEFHRDGTISDNGGHVDYQDLTDEMIDVLPELEREFVREFMNRSSESAFEHIDDRFVTE